MELATTTYMNKWQQCGWRQPQLLYVNRWRAMSMEPATNMLADGSHVAGTSHNNVTRWSMYVDGANHYHVDILIFRFNYVFSLLKVATILSVRLREAVLNTHLMRSSREWLRSSRVVRATD
jgi:hypothetical protein